jgi:uncharacterized protein YbjT (DUF2867 family)
LKTIAIIGAAGTNARSWVNAFLATGWQVRNLVRDPSRAARCAALTAVRFDFDDPRTYEPALVDVDVLALISPAQPEQIDWESKLILAAEHGPLRGIIKLSVMGADMAEPISFFARNAAQIEGVLRASRVPHVILRANGFMQNLLRQRASIEAGSLVEPSGAMAASRVDVSDLADVAVTVANGPFDGRTLTLTGPEALTGDEMAATLSATLGRPVRYISPPLAQFHATLTERGLPAWQVDALVELQEAILAGRAPHLAQVTADVQTATGRSPRSFAQFAKREFRAAPGHVAV